MFFADLLNLLVFPTPLLLLLASVSWYFVFKPPSAGRFTRLRKRSLRRREAVRAIYLVLALCCTLLLAAFAYSLISGGQYAGR
jgi:predicted PurR-regulated permease PerM